MRMNPVARSPTPTVRGLRTLTGAAACVAGGQPAPDVEKKTWRMQASSFVSWRHSVRLCGREQNVESRCYGWMYGSGSFCGDMKSQVARLRKRGRYKRSWASRWVRRGSGEGDFCDGSCGVIWGCVGVREPVAYIQIEIH